jgi:TPR repeat protein
MLSSRSAQRLLLAFIIAVGAAMAASAPSHAGPLEDAFEALGQEDYPTALKLLRPMAEGGFAEAQYHLGVMYQYGEGMPPDMKEAARWYRAAAEQGYALAQTNLGLMYHNGDGVPQDNKEAARWYRAAAVQGDATAQIDLALSYHVGAGVPNDPVRAHMWANIAAANGEAKDTRDHIAETLTASQIEQATEMAKRCMDSKYKDCGD